MGIRTVGHGNRGIGEFLGLLAHHQVNPLVDMRGHPLSRRYPRFASDLLRYQLDGAGIRHHFAGRSLCGRRAARRDRIHLALESEERDFADHMQGEKFRRASRQLQDLASDRQTAIMSPNVIPLAVIAH